jgi:hypothetical protein
MATKGLTIKPLKIKWPTVSKLTKKEKLPVLISPKVRPFKFPKVKTI